MPEHLLDECDQKDLYVSCDVTGKTLSFYMLKMCVVVKIISLLSVYLSSLNLSYSMTFFLPFFDLFLVFRLTISKATIFFYH
jgi:hypothetical protein